MHNKIDIGELIFQKLKEKERNVMWLAKKVGCDDSNLGKMLKGYRYINLDLLFAISIVYIYYSLYYPYYGLRFGSKN